MISLSSDERAAARAFLQRAEVRLSTLHRVATALLSGAGLMVLLPALAKDSIVLVVRSLLIDDRDVAHLCLIGAMVTLLALPVVALGMVLRDLTLFYFHAQHLSRPDRDVFTPRYTLTGLQLPADELGVDAAGALAAARAGARNIEVLVPLSGKARHRIDRQLDAYGGLGRLDTEGDLGRARGLMELSASTDRLLVDEVAKVEYGLARHILKMQIIVLRYVKALLAFVTTAIAVFAAAAVLTDVPEVGPTQELWLVAITSLWAPTIVAVVAAPVRWLDQMLRAEGARQSATANDPELTKVERAALWFAGAAWLLVAVGLGAVVNSDSADGSGVAAATVCVAVGGVALWGQVALRSIVSRRH